MPMKVEKAQTAYAFSQQRSKLQPHQRKIVGCSYIINLPQNVLTKINEICMRKREIDKALFSYDTVNSVCN